MNARSKGTRGATKAHTPIDRRLADREKNQKSRGFTSDQFDDLRDSILSKLPDATALERELVERLVMNLRLADRHLAEAHEDPWIKGSRGQLVEHPGFRVAARCDAQAVTLSKMLDLHRQEHRVIDEEETGELISLARAAARRSEGVK